MAADAVVDLPTIMCQCCGHEPSIGVAAIPGVPMSIAWCVTCLQAGVVPPWVIVAELALSPGVEAMADWWLDGIAAPTLHHFDKGFDWLMAEVEKDRAEEAAYWARQDA